MQARGLGAAFNEPRKSYGVHIYISEGITPASPNKPHTKHNHTAPAEKSAWNLCRIWREVAGV